MSEPPPQTPPPSPSPPPGPQPARDFTSLYRATVTPLRRYLARLLGNTTASATLAASSSKTMRTFIIRK